MVGVLGPVYDDRQLRSLIRKLPKNLKDEMSNSLFEFAQKSANSLRMETLSDPSQSPDRKKYAEQIYAEKLSKFKSVVKAPLNLVYLDSMKPHYVALKRGRKIVSWTRKYFGSQVRSGRSRVFKGPRGGIKGFVCNSSSIY